MQQNTVHVLEANKAAGFLQLKNARVRWFLSIDYNDIPQDVRERGARTFRSITVEGREIEFSDGFTDLHTASYRHILEGKGFGLECARQSIQTVYDIRNSKPIGKVGDYHPFVK